MIYPENFEIKLGFDQIREILKQECLSTLGQAYVEKVRFTNDFDLITKLLRQTADFKKILEQEALFPSQNYIDVTPYFSSVRVEGSFLEPSSFFEIKISLKTITRCLEFFEDTGDVFPALNELTAGIHLDRSIYKRLDEIIDDKGNLRDNASSELQEIRRKILAEQIKLRKELDRILNALKREGYADEDVSITIRNGRMVVPVIAEHKRKVKGFIHDESATGHTVFIEPTQIFDINNEIQELEYQERREIIRILTALTDFLRPFLPELKKAYVFLGLIDFIRAKAKFALMVGGTFPQFQKQQLIHWRQAKHPLLYLSHKKNGKSIVPLNLKLNPNERILIISGPNAGGKSVTLKTVGLVQYMLQSGILPTVEEGSVVGIFNDVFIDIGDEQSIENDLSTYSSHLSNMKYFLSFAGKKTLVLIDEFGTGTEPQFGAAIAESVLERLNNLKVFGVITTHYANLKAMAEKTEGIVNGSMVFDMEKLEPLYQLEIGKPGSSFALEIAQKIGLPKDLLESAKGKLDVAQIDFEKLNKDLELEKSKFRNKNENIFSKEKHLDEQIKKYTELKSFVDTHQKRLINEAKEKAKQLVYETNQKIENTIRQIKESNAEKETTKTVREDLKKFSENKLEPEYISEPKVTSEEPLTGPIKEGDYVMVRGSGAYGKVVAIKEKDVEILVGSLKSNVKLNRLEKVTRKEFRQHVGEEETYEARGGINLGKKMAEFTSNIDLRGKRGEEALGEVDSLIDTALIFGVSEVRIVHGKGDGILRTLIRNHLKNYKQVLSMQDEHADRGGAGVTIVKLI